MATIVSTATRSDGQTTTLNFTVPIPDGSNMVAFVLVSGQRSNTDPTLAVFNYDVATMNGTAMTLVANQNSTATNRFFRTRLYKVVDPRDEGTKPATQTINIVASRSLASMSAIVVFVAGVSEHKTAQTLSSDGSVTEISTELTNEATPSLILVGGMIRDRVTNYDVLTPLGDTVDVVKVGAGTGEFTSHIGVLGYVDATATDTYTVGWEWNTVDPAHLIVLEVVGTLEAGYGAGWGENPQVIYGDFDLEGESGYGAGYGRVPEIVLGSIPPVQVIGRGNLYFSTAARTLTVILLATSGDNWVITKAGGAEAEELGLTVGRRKGYTVPQ